MKVKQTDRDFIKHLMSLYEEKRGDVYDICTAYLQTGEIRDDLVEHRYIQARIPDTRIEVEYDTLTTLLSFHKPTKQWSGCVDHKYLND